MKSTNYYRNILSYLKHQPMVRTLPLESGYTITYIDEHILSYDSDGNAKGFQDEVVFVAQMVKQDGTLKPYYMGLDWHNINQDALLDQIETEQAKMAMLVGGGERAMRDMIPDRR